MGNVGFFEKYKVASFFGKLTNECMTVQKVREMADEYENNGLKIITECDTRVKKANDDAKEKAQKDLLTIESLKNTVDSLNTVVDDKDKIISELRLSIKDSVEVHNRANETKETIISKLNQEIVKLKEELLNKDREHKQCTEDLKVANSKKMRGIATECADALLKADRKNNKPVKVKEEPTTVVPEKAPELPTLEEKAGIDDKKSKAKKGTRLFTVQQIKDIKDRRAKGESVIDIAKSLGVHKSTINRAFKK